ncbi:phosphoglucomutase/phosphomannomutase family protein [Candidatus Saganbacteria bacterium]|nr:phosphoglucomutase/phosphomannomutase family protein [Candidatus Saganbacteria bacterium]
MIKFGTDGWRAIISDEFTFDNVRRVAKAIALYLINNKKADKPIIIGYDPRFLADKFAYEVAKVMEEAGIDVFIPDRDVPTPVIAWSIKYIKPTGACGAVMLTASHNPPQYCGIKFIPEYQGPANETITKELAENSNSEIELPKPDKKGKIEHFNPRASYFEYLEKIIDVDAIRAANLKVAYDPMFGSGRDYTDMLLEKCGCKVEAIHNYRDVLFGGSNPEPSDEQLGELKRKVVQIGSNLGLANDGDADRFGVVDEAGDCYSANQIISMVFDYLAADKKYTGSVAKSIATTSMIDVIAKQHNIKLHETKVGFKYIAEHMMNEDVIIGGEESGGLSIKGHIPEKDGVLACLLVVEMVARKEKALSQIWKDLTKKYGPFEGRRGKIELDENKKQKLIETLKNNPPSSIDGLKVAGVKKIDGVKMILEDGSWFLIRPSGTEPMVRIYAESCSKKSLDAIDNYLKTLV